MRKTAEIFRPWELCARYSERSPILRAWSCCCRSALASGNAHVATAFDAAHSAQCPESTPTTTAKPKHQPSADKKMEGCCDCLRWHHLRLSRRRTQHPASSSAPRGCITTRFTRPFRPGSPAGTRPPKTGTLIQPDAQCAPGSAGLSDRKQRRKTSHESNPLLSPISAAKGHLDAASGHRRSQ